MMKDFIVVVLLCIVFNTKAQFIQNSITDKDTINIKFETVAAISNHAYQPHWITYNNWGVINESEQLNLVGIASVEATVQLIKDVSFQYGLEAVVRNSSSIPYETEKASVYFNEWYIGVNLKSLYIGGGARKMIMGDVNVELSSGSLHLSSNSRPIPQLLLTTNDWVEIPYTKEYLSFKGLFSHGWLSNERYIDDTYIHNKNFYLKLGKVNHAWFGINHSVVWGGDDHGDKLPSDWTAFWTVVKAGKYPHPDEFADKHYGEAINRYGFHTGTYDIGLSMNLNWAGVKLYHQSPFTDSSGMRKYIFNKDHLTGIEISLSNKWFSQIVLEWLNTSWQSGPGLSDPKINGETVPLTEENAHLYYDFYGDDVEGLNYNELAEFVKIDQNQGYEWGGRDNYYNNSIYQSGFSNKQMILGNSLMYSNYRFEQAVNAQSMPPGSFFVNNRVEAFHLGLKSKLNEGIGLLFKTTYSINKGTYQHLYGGDDHWTINDSYYFRTYKRMIYSSLEIEKYLSKFNSILNIKVGVDFGDMYSNAGIELCYIKNW